MIIQLRYFVIALNYCSDFSPWFWIFLFSMSRIFFNIIHILEKSSQEINFKCHSNNTRHCKWGKMLSYFILLDCAYFCNEIERCQWEESLKQFRILWPMKNNIRFEYGPWKNVWFCFISNVFVHFSHKV